jgi:hypothetical protein
MARSACQRAVTKTGEYHFVTWDGLLFLGSTPLLTSLGELRRGPFFQPQAFSPRAVGSEQIVRLLLFLFVGMRFVACESKKADEILLFVDLGG